MGAFARAAGRRILTGCLVQAVTTVLVVTCVGVGGIIALLLPIPPGADRGSVFLFMMMVSLSAAMLIAMLGVVIVMWRRQSTGDGVFTAIGLKGSPYVQGGRQYEGVVSGRSVYASWTPNGPRVVLEVGSSVATRWAIGTATGLGQAVGSLIGARSIDLSWDPGYSGMAASGHDDAWVRWALGQPALREQLVAIARQATASEMRVVIVAPGKVAIHLSFVPLTVLDAAVIHPLFNQLVQLAATLETMPQPHERLAPSSLEASARSISGTVSRFRLVALGFGALTAIGMGVAGLAGVIAVMAGAF